MWSGWEANVDCFYGWALFELWMHLRSWRHGSLSRDAFSRYLMIGGKLAAHTSAVAAARPHAFDFAAARPELFGLGLAMMGAGLLFRLCAIQQLGRDYVPEVTIQPGQRFVDHGLDRHLRRPSCTGIFVTSRRLIPFVFQRQKQSRGLVRKLSLWPNPRVSCLPSCGSFICSRSDTPRRAR